MEPFKIEPGSVQETLIIPLYGRKLCAELFPKLHRDESAARICDSLDYDFSDLDRQAESTLWRFGALEAAMRQLDMQWEIDDYLANHPHAAVVNMGCGLDQTGRACDNGTCRIYNVDMPDIIAARETLSPAGERERNIASDLNDFSWMDRVDGSGGAIFFAAGVFCYLTFSQAKALANELAHRFPGGRLVFDTMGKLGKKLMRATFKNFGMENYDDCLFVEDLAEVEAWVPAARASSRGYMLGYYDMDDPAVTSLHRFLARRCDQLVKMRIVRMDFAGKLEEQPSTQGGNEMKPDYKNWMPKGMVLGTLAGSVGSFGLSTACGCTGLIKNETRKTALTGTFLLAGVAAGGAALWMTALYRAFSYDGKRQMSKQIIEGIAAHVQLPDGGKGLDVGCGSGALAIACAKRNPNAAFVGIDRWGKEYASYNKPLCENNAKAEGVNNVSFERGDATRLDFPDESFDAVVSNYVYHNILVQDRQALLLESLRVLKKGGTFAVHDIFSKSKYGDMRSFVEKLKDAGYEQVELVDTTNGLFMAKGEATWMGLSGSALLVGKK